MGNTWHYIGRRHISPSLLFSSLSCVASRRDSFRLRLLAGSLFPDLLLPQHNSSNTSLHSSKCISRHTQSERHLSHLVGLLGCGGIKSIISDSASVIDQFSNIAVRSYGKDCIDCINRLDLGTCYLLMLDYLAVAVLARLSATVLALSTDFRILLLAAVGKIVLTSLTASTLDMLSAMLGSPWTHRYTLL
jgi:hypothetical protein